MNQMNRLNDNDNESDTKLYCICRTPDTSRFMIGCDECNEWYHGDCISITEEYAKRIQQFYCLMCRENDSTLQIKFKERKSVKKKEKETVSDAKAITDHNERNSVTIQKISDPDYEPIANKLKVVYKSDDNDNDNDDDDEDEYYPSDNNKRKKHDKDKSLANRRGRPVRDGKRRKAGGRSLARSHHRKKEEGNKKMHKKNKEWHVIEVESGPKQCYGPACVNTARKASKYCSDECGIKLASNRIYEILPHRIRQWQSTPCEADERSSKALELIRNEQQEARNILTKLDNKQRELESMIETGKSTPPLTEEESNEVENEAESELSMYCVTCGHEINHKLALKHMERCFNKYEAQTSFGSIFKTKIEGQTVFCDVYNPQQRTYCKRLRILCPEHSKDPKITDDEVCGCPLMSVSNPFEHNGRFCRLLKKKCNKHHGWEKLRRAELDAERIQQWLKLDDLFEREQKFRYCMANRHGILGLMLHQTIVHEENSRNSLL